MSSTEGHPPKEVADETEAKLVDAGGDSEANVGKIPSSTEGVHKDVGDSNQEKGTIDVPVKEADQPTTESQDEESLARDKPEEGVGDIEEQFEAKETGESAEEASSSKSTEAVEDAGSEEKTAANKEESTKDSEEQEQGEVDDQAVGAVDKTEEIPSEDDDDSHENVTSILETPQTKDEADGEKEDTARKDDNASLAVTEDLTVEADGGITEGDEEAKGEDDRTVPEAGNESEKPETEVDVAPVVGVGAENILEAKDDNSGILDSEKSLEKETDSTGSGFIEKVDSPVTGGEEDEDAGTSLPEKELGSEEMKDEEELLDDQSKDSWVEGGNGDDDGDDGFQETEEPMETDEFDEVERAVKEERKQQSELSEARATADKEDGCSRDEKNPDGGTDATKSTDEVDGNADELEKESDEVSDAAGGIEGAVNAATEPSDGIKEREDTATLPKDSVGEKADKEKKPSDGSHEKDDGDKSESKDPLTESQEMLMQYDGEDLLETLVSDGSDSDRQNRTDSQDEKTAVTEPGEEEPMEVDDSVPSETKEAARDYSDGQGAAKESSKDSDVIDMIEERTVSPSLHSEKAAEAVEEAGKKEEQVDKEESSSDIIILDDVEPKKSDEDGDKTKETTPPAEKKRKLGTLGSIVSRLTQNVKEKQSEEGSSKLVVDKSIPVISQVKTLTHEPVKEKVGRKQVYKTEDVVNRCSVCFQPFLSLNPIKFNNNVFCSDDCLHEKKGASSDSTPCSYCKKVFKKDSSESCSIEFGTQRKRFCSSNCKTDYQKKVKPCSNCGEDITGTSNAFMAQVGSEGKFMEFCSQNCVESYEKKIKDQPQQTKKDSGEKKACSMCRKLTSIKHEVKFRGSYYHMCGTDCFSNFRKKYSLSLRTCNQCGTTCYNEHSPGDDKDGHKVFFCSQKCLEVFQQSRSLSEPCFSCKTMYKQGMLMEGKASSGKVYKFCSQECMQKVLPSTTSNSVATTVTPSTSTPKTTNVVPAQGPRMATQVQTSAKPSVQPRIVQTSTNGAGSGQNQGSLPCNHCKKLQRPLYHLTMSDSSLRNFCSYPCVIAFQAQFNVPPVTLPQETLLLRCGQCHRGFSHRPQTLDYQGETRLFCNTACLDDFKRTQSIIAICDCCFEEKILFEETNFLGKARYFCSPGCSLIFKNQFVKRIGLRCAMCDYCSTMCKVATVTVLGGSKKRFCAEECRESYHQWYNKMARCEGCKRMGCELTESFRWRGKVKRVCNEQCLLLFYTQQNVPDMGTQLQSELNPPVKPTENGTGSFPTITNVKSLAGPHMSDATAQVKHIPMAHKQTQITTNTIFVKPPPPPPMPPPPAPKQVRNKMTLCKPYAVSKATTCYIKPTASDQGTQTDLQPILVPVPIPIFVPVPMQMYTSPFPHPVGIPIPIPTPMFVPVAYNNCDRLMACIDEIKNTIPSDPLEADILMMATAIAGKEESKPKPVVTEKPPPPEDDDDHDEDDITDLLPLKDSEVLDIPNKFLESDSDIAGILADSLEAIDSADLFPEERVTRASSRVTRNSSQNPDDGEGSSSRRVRTRGAKRSRVDGDDDEEPPQSPPGFGGKEDVRPDIGPAAYNFYLQQTSKDGDSQNSRLKSDLSLASVDELHYCLCRFVREARQPDGEVYPADTLFLILLSIQKYLMTKERKENIFMDPYFQTFANLLHERIGEHSIIADPMVGIEPGATCLDEEFLWDSKQLGAHSPSVLLSTILYYCTKELMLKTVAMHQVLAFSRVQRLVRKDSRGKREAYIRFLPSEEQKQKESEGKGKKRPLDIDYTLELRVNTKQPLRCPVKLYEFYISKCPESVKTSRNIFYLVPERACVPDSPLWYSDKAVPDKMVERFLWRHLIVKDIHEHWEMLKHKNEEGESSGDDF